MNKRYDDNLGGAYYFRPPEYFMPPRRRGCYRVILVFLWSFVLFIFFILGGSTVNVALFSVIFLLLGMLIAAAVHAVYMARLANRKATAALAGSKATETRVNAIDDALNNITIKVEPEKTDGE